MNPGLAMCCVCSLPPPIEAVTSLGSLYSN